MINFDYVIAGPPVTAGIAEQCDMNRIYQPLTFVGFWFFIACKFFAWVWYGRFFTGDLGGNYI